MTEEQIKAEANRIYEARLALRKIEARIPFGGHWRLASRWTQLERESKALCAAAGWLRAYVKPEECGLESDDAA